MAGVKFSRQRQAIMDYLCSTKEHPTAETVYTNVRLNYPNVSLGTVYRNLNLLADEGEIASGMLYAFKRRMMPAGVAHPYAGSPMAIRPKPRQVTPKSAMASFRHFT